MSRHWNPYEELGGRACPQHARDRELIRRLAAEEEARARKRPWPEGATAGLVLIAASCLTLGLLLYQVAGPREVVEESVAGR